MKNPNPTLIGVQAYLTDERRTQKGSAMLHTMSNLGGLAEEAAALLSQAAEETVGGIMANAFSHMSWLKSAAMQRMFSKSDFAPEDINNGRTSVYFALPPQMVSSHERALRLVTNSMIVAAFKGRKKRGKPATLFVLDEAAALGALPILPKAVAILRGFGARVLFFYQAMSQP